MKKVIFVLIAISILFLTGCSNLVTKETKIEGYTIRSEMRDIPNATIKTK